MKMNNETIANFRKDFAQAVKQVEEKYGVDISLGSIRYSLNDFSTSFKVQNKGLDIDRWNWYCDSYGFKPEDLGKSFIYKRHEYTIVGLKKNTKFPIMTTRDDGQSTNFTPEAVKEAMLE